MPLIISSLSTTLPGKTGSVRSDRKRCEEKRSELGNDIHINTDKRQRSPKKILNSPTLMALVASHNSFVKFRNRVSLQNRFRPDLDPDQGLTLQYNGYDLMPEVSCLSYIRSNLRRAKVAENVKYFRTFKKDMTAFHLVYFSPPRTNNRKETTMSRKNCNVKSGNLIEIDETKVTRHLSEIVRGTVEETLNSLLRRKPIDCAMQRDSKAPQG